MSTEQLNIVPFLDNLCGQGNWVAYCINLKRASERRAQFDAWAKSINLPFKWWEATDKLTLTPEDYKLCDVWVNGTIQSNGATACRISHHLLSKHLLQQYANVEYFFIFEDDAGFKRPAVEQFAELTDFLTAVKGCGGLGWNTLQFGYHDTGFRKLARFNDKVNVVLNCHLAHAQLIHRSQVDAHVKILEDPQSAALPVDWTYDLLRKFNVSRTLGPINTVIDQVDPTSFIWQ